ncbi:hypothetical protein Poli38472_012846 [Pythium oligandrum]|uniref:DOT1 domain-containing protein n=1 Tax=Pythium oligandrum TaxID=41045 RepID=A0A8K1CIK2_PYTOL|nr:hypothetical protein Poli38472_012846 [Pythium oligandrum]|eukprot:TMW64224.1 hypothetical protein Poli38472_012846 [Pythium oligandrum]
MPMVAAVKKLGDGEGAAFRTPVKRSVRQKTSPGLSTPNALATPEEMSVDSTATNKRKRKSIGTSTVKAMSNCYLSTNKKRARTSLSGPGTPGKATPLDAVRERDVAKRFLELEVTEVYKAIRKQTGALGGNAAGGAIYGEITQSSFQRVVDYLKENCELSEASLFLDVGSGLGKPNMHVAIDPGVEVSYGVELEELRWHLSLHNLRSVLQLDVNKSKPNRTIFTAGDITDAQTFNPFSHVYSFDVGFPPDVMAHMATMFNRSEARYFISFHSPRKVIESYGFHVENIGRVATSMAGSSEGHTCYFYRQVEKDGVEASPADKENVKRQKRLSLPASTSEDKTVVDKDALLQIDPLFRPGFEILGRGKDGVLAYIESFFGEQQRSGRTRNQKRSSQPQQRQERPLESYYRVVGKARVGDRAAKK